MSMLMGIFGSIQNTKKKRIWREGRAFRALGFDTHTPNRPTRKSAQTRKINFAILKAKKNFMFVKHRRWEIEIPLIGGH